MHDGGQVAHKHKQYSVIEMHWDRMSEILSDRLERRPTTYYYHVVYITNKIIATASDAGAAVAIAVLPLQQLQWPPPLLLLLQ